MKVLLDLNVLLDVILSRSPWNVSAAQVWDASQSGAIGGHVAVVSFPTLFYIVRRQIDLVKAHEAVRDCADAFNVLEAGDSTIALARTFPGSDFEDNLQIAVAVENGMDAIVTRDPAGFVGGSVPVMTPDQLLATLAASGGATP